MNSLKAQVENLRVNRIGKGLLTVRKCPVLKPKLWRAAMILYK